MSLSEDKSLALSHVAPHRQITKIDVLSGLLHGNVMVLILTINKLPLIDAMHA